MEGIGQTGFAGRGDWWLPRYEHFFVAALIAFILGNVAAFSFPDNILTDWRVIVCLLLVLLGVLIASQTRRVIRSAMWWMVFLVGMLWFTLFSVYAEKTATLARLAPMDDVQISGVVIDHPNGNPHRAFVDVTAVNREAYSGRVLVTASRFTLPIPGMRTTLEGKLVLPREALVPGEFNERAYLKTENASAVLRDVRTMRIEPVTVPTLQMRTLHYLDEVRTRMADVFTSVLPSPDAEVLGGIVLGGRAIPVDKITKRQFVDTGLVHILAASGMNVGIVAAFVFWLAGLFRLTRRVRIAVAMGAVAFYAVLTGLPPSIQRAATMLELALLLKLLNKELSPLFLLCIAAALLVAIDPFLVGSLGFQFSVLTTFGLITMTPPLQNYLGRYITRALAGIILVPFIAQLWVVPLTLFHFNQFPLHSVLLNMLALFFVVPLTSIGFTAGALSLLWAPLGKAVTWLAWPFLKGLLGVVQLGDTMSWARMSLPAPEPWLLAGLYGLLLFVTLLFYQWSQWPLTRKAWLGLSLILLLLLPLAIGKLRQDGLQVTVVPLSYRHAGFVVQETPAAPPLVLVPEALDYWEGRRMSDYLRNRNENHLFALLTWGAGSSEETTGLSVISQRRQIDHRLRLFPERQGARLGAGALKVQQLKEGLFRLDLGEGLCLAIYGSKTDLQTPCALSYYEDETGYRLLPGRFMAPERFYRLHLVTDNTLALFEGQ